MVGTQLSQIFSRVKGTNTGCYIEYFRIIYIYYKGVVLSVDLLVISSCVFFSGYVTSPYGFSIEK